MSYIEDSKEISEQLNNFLTDLYKDDNFLNKIIDVYTRKEIHLNAVQFAGGFYAGGGNKKRLKDFYLLPIILELTMLWAYKTNQIVDEKKEVWKGKDNIKKCVIDHDMIMVLIFDLLSKSENVLGENYYKFESVIKKLMTYLLKGYDVEKYELSISESDISVILDKWNENYTNRNKYFNFVYDYSPLIGFWIASDDYKIIERYENYLLNKGDTNTFGGYGQIINDIGDWSVSPDTQVKVYQDKFADIRNGIITFPVYKFIEYEDIKLALRDPEITFNKDWQKRVSVLVIKLLPEIKKSSKKMYKVISDFWKENTSPEADLTLLMNSYLIIKMSRYLHEDQYTILN